MVNNKYNFENGNEAFNYLIKVLNIKFSEFKIVDKTDVDINKSKFGFFDIWILYKEISFRIGCERGVLHYSLEVDGTKMGLHLFDERMNDVLAFSKENILFTLSVFKVFVDQLQKTNKPVG